MHLDLDLEIRNGKIDDRDAFSFSIVNYPDLSGNIPAKQSYGVFVSQLIRYGRCCLHVEDFISRTKTLISRQVKGLKSVDFVARSKNSLHATMSFYSNTIIQLITSFCKFRFYVLCRYTSHRADTITGSMFALLTVRRRNFLPTKYRV